MLKSVFFSFVNYFAKIFDENKAAIATATIDRNNKFKPTYSNNISCVPCSNTKDAWDKELT